MATMNTESCNACKLSFATSKYGNTCPLCGIMQVTSRFYDCEHSPPLVQLRTLPPYARFVLAIPPAAVEADATDWLVRPDTPQIWTGPAAHCPLPPRYGFAARSDERPVQDFIRRLATFAEKSRVAAYLHDGPQVLGNMTGCDRAIIKLLPRGKAENMFFAALMPWLRTKIGWSIHELHPRSVDVVAPQTWLIMRILPAGVPVIGTQCPAGLAPADFEQCQVRGLEFLHIYTGHDEARHMGTVARLAQAGAAETAEALFREPATEKAEAPTAEKAEAMAAEEAMTPPYEPPAPPYEPSAPPYEVPAPP